MKRLMLFIFLMPALLSCRKPATQLNEHSHTLVRVVTPGKEKISFPVRTSGIVVPAKEIKLSFKTGGIISRLNVEEGARVKKGTLLASLDVAEIEAQVKQAENGYEKAQRDFSRAKNLYTDSVATLEQYQNAATALNVAKAVLDIARFNLQHSSIFAPEDGVILKGLSEAYELTGAGYPVFIFGTTGIHWKVKTGLADRDFVKVMPGDSAVVSLDAYPGESFKAIVSQMGEAANPATGTYELELELEPLSNRLASGFIANIEIFPSRSDSFIRVPVEALVEAEGKTGYVFVVNDSAIANKTKVEISGVDEIAAAVSAGLQGNELIVIEGAAYLTHGEKVEIVK